MITLGRLGRFLFSLPEPPPRRLRTTLVITLRGADAEAFRRYVEGKANVERRKAAGK
jgi:hypothetical protein